jgi:LysR family hydrogen peroxide-inducible transcriptional activator
LRVADVEGVNVLRSHALAWRSTSPQRHFYKELATEIQSIVRATLSEIVIPMG